MKCIHISARHANFYVSPSFTGIYPIKHIAAFDWANRFRQQVMLTHMKVFKHYYVVSSEIIIHKTHVLLHVYLYTIMNIS